MYLRKRFKFQNVNIRNLKGLIVDVYEFIRLNNIPIDTQLANLKDYLQTNFVGFLTENKSKVVFRNIDDNSSFR